MHKIKEMLMKELYEYEEKAKKMNGGKLSAGDLETLHKLTDTVKNIDKIEMLEGEDDEYSEAGNWMADGRMYGTYDDGSSYARGRRGRGRNARRDSMGRYAREGGSSYEGGYSEERGRQGGNRGDQGGNRGGNMGGRSSYAGGYSYGDAKDYMMDKMEEMMEMAETPKERQAIQRCMRELEQQ